jgi:hypothetical protein
MGEGAGTLAGNARANHSARQACGDQGDDANRHGVRPVVLTKVLLVLAEVCGLVLLVLGGLPAVAVVRGLVLLVAAMALVLTGLLR